jgi:hypothetical protein
MEAATTYAITIGEMFLFYSKRNIRNECGFTEKAELFTPVNQR